MVDREKSGTRDPDAAGKGKSSWEKNWPKKACYMAGERTGREEKTLVSQTSEWNASFAEWKKEERGRTVRK